MDLNQMNQLQDQMNKASKSGTSDGGLSRSNFNHSSTSLARSMNQSRISPAQRSMKQIHQENTNISTRKSGRPQESELGAEDEWESDEEE